MQRIKKTKLTVAAVCNYIGHTNADLQQPALTHKRQGHSRSSPIWITVFKKLDLTIRSALIQSTITTFFNTQTLQPGTF